MTPARRAILEEMGYTLWALREEQSIPQQSAPEIGLGQAVDVATAPAEELPVPLNTPAAVSGQSEEALSSQALVPEFMSESHDEPPAIHEIPDYLFHEDGEREFDEPHWGDTPPADARLSAIARMGWDELAGAVQECKACELCQHRHQAVLGVGDQQADWLFVGEGPGAEEDAKGEPFVGQAGKLLDAMLAAIGLKRGQNVYIANAVKCRPEGNRTPHADEMAACRPFLQRQIALLQPKLMILLGKAAVHSVLGEDKSLASMRQRLFQYGDIPVLVSYHPAYLLRNLPEKAKAWEDLCLARRQMDKAKGN